jgi:hypothetical protein
LVSSSHLGLTTRFLLLSDNCGFVDVRHSLTRERVCRLQLLLVLARAVILGPSPAGLVTIFHCLIIETPQPKGPGPRIYIPQEQVCPDIPPGTGFSFRRLRRLTGLRWRYSNSPPRGATDRSHMSSLYDFGKERREFTTSKSFSIFACLFVAAETCLASRCVAMDVSAVLL